MLILIDLSTPEVVAHLEFIECRNSCIEVRVLFNLEAPARKTLFINCADPWIDPIGDILEACRSSPLECVRDIRLKDPSDSHETICRNILSVIHIESSFRAEDTSLLLSGTGYDLVKQFKEGLPVWRVIRGAGGSDSTFGLIKFASLKQIHDLFGFRTHDLILESGRKAPAVDRFFVQ